ncbi:MAG TPA: hypothetical protein VMZ69_08040, partial [Saprospiraceae bacterium]|nr:hypothetical protein [Saprospiraceae bacterium]
MSGQESIMGHLEEVFRKQEAGLNGQTGSHLHDFQKKSFESLSRILFPDRKHEDWKYTAVQKLISPKYNLPSHLPHVMVRPIPALDSYIISIVNGKVDLKDAISELTSLGVKILSLSDAFDSQISNDNFIKWVNAFDKSSNKAFELLNYSFNTSGFYLEIPKNLILDKPLEIRIVHDDPATSFSHPLFFIRCGAGSKIQIVERFETNQSGFANPPESLINSIGYIQLEKNANVSHIKWQDLPITQ